jgi:hypothetical protein
VKPNNLILSYRGQSRGRPKSSRGWTQTTRRQTPPVHARTHPPTQPTNQAAAKRKPIYALPKSSLPARTFPSSTPPPSDAPRSVEPVCRTGAARASPAGAPRTRSDGTHESATDRPEQPRARACCWYVLEGGHTPSAPGTMLSTPQGSARRPNPTKYPRARASSTGAGRCWLDTTTPEGHFERYTTAPRPIQSLPGLAQNRFISGSRDARRGAQGGMGPPATEYCGTRFDAGLQNAEIAFLGGWYKFETP